MTGHTLRQGTWVAVCDGRKALLLENKGSAEYPKLETREHFEHKSAATHAQGSSAPGRAFSSAGGRRGSVEQSDFHDQDELAFLRKFAECLERHTRNHEVKSLILVAPARALGMIRPVLAPSTRQALVAELDRDYVKLPLYEIEERLKG
jgi:protein required for attachment to host cells